MGIFRNKTRKLNKVVGWREHRVAYNKDVVVIDNLCIKYQDIEDTDCDINEIDNITTNDFNVGEYLINKDSYDDVLSNNTADYYAFMDSYHESNKALLRVNLIIETKQGNKEITYGIFWEDDFNSLNKCEDQVYLIAQEIMEQVRDRE